MTEEIPNSRQAKAESLVINSVGHRPTNRDVQSHQALKGRNPDSALSGLRLRGFRQDRALPYPIDNKAFSLNLTAMRRSLTSLCYVRDDWRFLCGVDKDEAAKPPHLYPPYLHNVRCHPERSEAE